jgi:Co/Zn/Cd efflux system component
MVGVGQFAQGMARRTEQRRQTHGWRRVGGVITAVLATVVLVLVIIGRVAGHL